MIKDEEGSDNRIPSYTYGLHGSWAGKSIAVLCSGIQHYMQRLQRQPILTLLAGRIVCLRIVACVLPYYQHCSALITAPVIVVSPLWDKGSEFLYTAHKHRKKWQSLYCCRYCHSRLCVWFIWIVAENIIQPTLHRYCNLLYFIPLGDNSEQEIRLQCCCYNIHPRLGAR
jgi:hypothetical protein